MGKITISGEPEKNGAALYEHLQPLVDALLQHGNRLARHERWGSTREGFACYLQEPIDFDLVKAKFTLPESIVLSERNGLIACRKTWATIYGNVPAREGW